MVEIKYKGNYEVADLAGKTLADVRKDYKTKFGIPDKARISLNDRGIRGSQESEIRLRDSDEIRFTQAGIGRGAILVGAMLLALAVTGGVFAFGYLTNTVTLTDVTSAGDNFARVTANSSGLSWRAYGNFKGTIGTGSLFDVDTQTANYTGDLVVDVYLANADQLAKVYRTLVLKLRLIDGNGNWVDIDASGSNTTSDFQLLTLDNAHINMFITSPATVYTVQVLNGFYVTNVYSSAWVAGYQQPQLFAQVSQR